MSNGLLNSKKLLVMRIINFIVCVICVFLSQSINAASSSIRIAFLETEQRALTEPNKLLEQLTLAQSKHSLSQTEHAYNNTLLARLYLFQGDTKRAQASFKLARQQLPEQDNWILGYWLMYRSILSLEEAKLPDALKQIRFAQAAFQDSNDPQMLVQAKTIEGTLLLWQEEYTRSIQLIENAYIEAKTTNMSATTMLYVYTSLAAYYTNMQLYEQGLQYAVLARDIANKSNDVVNGLPALHTLCLSYARAEKLTLATRCYDDMISLSAEVKVPRYLFWAPAGKAIVALQQANYNEALQLLYLAKSYVNRVIMNPAHIIALNNNFATAFLALKQPEQALDYILEAELLLQDYDRPLNNRYSRQTLTLKAQSLEQLGRFADAVAALKLLVKLNDEAKESTQQKLEQEARSRFESTQQDIKLQLAEEKLKLQQITLDKLAKEGQLQTAYSIIGLLVILSVTIFALNQRRAYLRSQHRANTDPLTGAHNRRYILDFISQQLIDKQRDFSVSILDIDHFKQVNDLHGHAIGDQALIGFTTFLEQQLANTQHQFARFGGEEFIVVMPDLTLQQGHDFISALCITLKSLSLTDKKINLTSSAGVAQMTVGQTLNGLLKVADTNLYHAKNTGRDKVCS